MSGKSTIEWTDATWNPVRGCSKVSAGCKNCYAEKFAERWRGIPGHPFEQGFDLRLVPEKLGLPRTWKMPKRIFVNSMSDLFHEDVPFKFIFDVWNEMAITPWHTYQILTKRVWRMLGFFEWVKDGMHERGLDEWEKGMSILPNVWLGASVEDQRAADERIPPLLQVPAAVRFLSCEPLLGPVNLRNIGHWDALKGIDTARQCHLTGKVDWVIAGGESGHGARECRIEWIESLLEQCRAAGVPAFVKQLGAYPVWSGAKSSPIEPSRGKNADKQEWPESLRIQNFPELKGEEIAHR